MREKNPPLFAISKNENDEGKINFYFSFIIIETTQQKNHP